MDFGREREGEDLQAALVAWRGQGMVRFLGGRRWLVMPGRGLPCSLISALSRPSFPSPYRYCVWGYWATVSSLSAVRGKLRGVVGTFGWLFDGMGKGLRPMIYLRGCKPMVDLSRPGLLFLGKGWWRCWVASFAL